MKKLNVAITTCPICQGDLHITGLACDHCHTEIKGEFSFSKFNYINKETLYFIELFIKNRGNIKAVEKEMNVSYPTVKKLLDEAVVALGYNLDDEEEKEEVVQSKEKVNNLDILEMIKNGSISVENAIEKLKKSKK
ncbi:DUF2089 domain-containing protein [Acholeplasma hippikon]|uniref:Protein of uncharacterized function(DUF2089) n=1 Tax=Acholeplasma hippikon TaxID=264636 RepID=A0A449BHR3_9MOLU|nr:DUF2089 domain-containing protein [Acholeplasma hippikon]VEU82001.1 Protein of uncharacterised function(DUF2089) [Acholeplasma hippikon]